MKMEILNKKITKQQEKVDALKLKSDEASDNYSEAKKELNALLRMKKKEEEKEKYSMLASACSEKNVDIKEVANAIKSGKFDVLFEAMKEVEQQMQRENGIDNKLVSVVENAE